MNTQVRSVTTTQQRSNVPGAKTTQRTGTFATHVHVYHSHPWNEVVWNGGCSESGISFEQVVRDIWELAQWSERFLLLVVDITGNRGERNGYILYPGRPASTPLCLTVTVCSYSHGRGVHCHCAQPCD